jgi:glycosyltransferase involved in cell wall biosynthesis
LSRNRALNNTRGDICVIADDDIVYERNYVDVDLPPVIVPPLELVLLTKDCC